MNIQAVLPTRGLIYAQTIQGLLENIGQENINIIIGKPMPDCFNQGVKQALSKGADYIWFVEEDNGLPRGTLDRMLAQKEKIVTIDYTVGGNNSHIYKQGPKILWCGLGCTLIAREVFENIPEPWFEVNKHLNFNGDGFDIVKIPDEVVGNKWAGHDALFFYTKTRPLGYTIKQIDGHIDHYRCKEVPKRELNNGQYSIYSL